MTAEPKRRPRPIGPRAVAPEEAETPAIVTDGDTRQYEMAAVTGFISRLPAGLKIQLDEASGGAVSLLMAGEQPRSALGFMVALAWIARRQRGDRLSWRQVEAFDDDQLADLLGELAEVMPGPKSPPSDDATSG